jgi:hypothetical protein
MLSSLPGLSKAANLGFLILITEFEEEKQLSFSIFIKIEQFSEGIVDAP